MTSRIPLLDLEAQNGPLFAEISAAFERTMRSGGFILGPEVEALESELASYIGVEHAVGVSSGTDALLAALMALGVGPGDEVITTPFTFFATAGCIARLGARPVFVDIEPETFNLDASKIEAAVTPRTKAIVPVHLFGQSCDMKAVLAAARGIPVIEDAAQALGARCCLGPVGKVGTVGCFSFFPSKNLGCFGDGGLVTTRDGDLAERIRVLRAHGAKPKYFHRVIGGNFRLDAVQAAILRVKLPHLERWHEGRRRNAAHYGQRLRVLPPSLLTTPPERHERHVYNQYVIRTPFRDALERHLADVGIATAVYYPKPLHLQDCFAALGGGPGDYPESERASNEVLALPVYPELGEERIERIADTVIEFLTSMRD